MENHCRTWENFHVFPHVAAFFSQHLRAGAKWLLHLIWMFSHILSLLFLHKLHNASLCGVLESAMEPWLRARPACDMRIHGKSARQRTTGSWGSCYARASRRRRQSARNTKSCSNWRECHVAEKIGRSTRGRCAHLYPGNTDTIHSIISPDLNGYSSELREFFS